MLIRLCEARSAVAISVVGKGIASPSARNDRGGVILKERSDRRISPKLSSATYEILRCAQNDRGGDVIRGASFFFVIARSVATWQSRRGNKARLPRGVYPERDEILRFAQNDRKRRARNDRREKGSQ